jgi:3-hydroxyisobutyrate dehydrogenase-like beta-hydroxyacid dehydrogenase
MGEIMQRTQLRTRIGFVGLGAMGAPLAGRLLYRNKVYGTNRTQSKASALIAEGLIWRDTPRAVAATAEVVFSMVTDDAALAAVTAGPDGILAGLRPGALYIDMSTVSPCASRELAERVRSVGATMIDAPVSGGVSEAETGTLAIMVGGTEAGYRAAEPLLLRLGSTVTHVGGNGQGLLLDLAVNISVAAQMVAFNEGVLLAERGGIDPVLAARAIGSPMSYDRVPAPDVILDLAEPARLAEQEPFHVALMHKDIRLALAAARESGLTLPVAVAVDSALSRARGIGHGHSDITRLYKRMATA